MSEFKKLSHTLYQCQYHVVFCPKYRYRILANDVAAYTANEIRALCRQKDLIDVVELNVQPDHVHLLLDVPPKYAVSSVMGFLKGKLALRLFQKYQRFGKQFWGRHLWSRGYCVSTVGLDAARIRKYVKWQERRDRQDDQLSFDL